MIFFFNSMVKITFIGHATFMLEAVGKRIYIDPYELSDKYKDFPGDGVLITHDHHDHFDEDSINKIIKSGTEFICPATCNGPQNKFKSKRLIPGIKSLLCGFEVEAVRAYNPNKKFHPRENGWLGYIITMDEQKIFHTGDSDYIPEYEELKGKVDVALLPVGDTYTMDFADGVKTVMAINPRITIPMHYWDKNPEEFMKLCKEAGSNTKVEILKDRALEL
jgi:L-ascorbate metabolism protein UlaG (beta-lactamase superfamily)